MIVNHVITLQISELSDREWKKLFSRLTYQAEGEIYEPWRIDPRRETVTIPRGAWSLVPDHVEYVDLRTFPEIGTLEFHGELDATLPDGRTFEHQAEAVKTIIEQEQGVVVRPPGTGKTDIVLAAAAKLGTRALFLVHTHDILEQWVERIERRLPDAKLGVIQGSRNSLGQVNVATVQTFRRRLDLHPELGREFGMVVLDEAHHGAAATFETILNEMWARYRIGVTATEKRADSRHPYIQTVIGPVIHREKFKSKVPVYCIPVKEHNFFYRMRGSWDYRNLLDALIVDEARNTVIAERVARMMVKGHSVLVLSREIKHLKAIDAKLAEVFNLDTKWIARIEQLTGERPKAVRNEILKRFRAGEIRCVLATQLADEALDVPILSCVVLTFPGKHDGRIIQQVGRALREHPGKEKAVILDVVDEKVGLLRRQWMLRKRAYKQMKIPVKKRKAA